MNWKYFAFGGLGAALIAGYNYKKAAQNLIFGFHHIEYKGFDDSGELQLRFFASVKNYSRYGFPVPTAIINFYLGDTFLGTGVNQEWQWIPGNSESVVFVDASLKIAEAAGAVTQMIIDQQFPNDIHYSGVVQIKNFEIPFGDQILLTDNSLATQN